MALLQCMAGGRFVQLKSILAVLKSRSLTTRSDALHSIKSLLNYTRSIKFSCGTGMRYFHSIRTSKQYFKLKHCLKNTELSTCIVFSGVTLGLGYFVCKGKLRTLDCKTSKHRNTRLVGVEQTYNTDDATFDWKQFFELLWSDILSLSLAIICAFAAAIVNIKLPLMVGEVVNVVSKCAIDNTANFLEEIKKPAINLLGIYLAQGALTVSYISLLSNVGENLAAKLRIKLFDSLLRQDIQFFDKHKTGELIDRLTSDIQDFKSSFKLCISQGLRAVTQTVGCIGALWIISPKLTGIMCVVIPVIIGIGSFMGSGLRKLSKAAQAQVAKSTAVADEALGNVRTVRAFAMEGKEHELFSQEVEKSRLMNIRLGVNIGMFQGLANIALNGVILGTLFVGGHFMSRGEVTAGDLMSFLVATQTVERSLAQISVLFGQAVRGLSAGARVFEYINHPFTVPLHGGKKIPYHTLQGDIEFNNVCFTYPTRPDQEVLKNFSLKIPHGRTVALVGSSGGGKSTIAALMERFYEIDSGNVTIDGVDLKTLDPSWLRGRAIGFINQEPVLFATSVLENIRYGRPDATDTEVYEAATLANAHNFIVGFPEGYNTILGERGVTVSGGQKQRIAIARALIKNPSILILDEATSALDAESERIVQEALDTVSRGRTVLVIAHRLSTIRDADIIAVVSHGQIVELGNHESLKKKKGLYWELIQQQEFEEEIRHY
ncbi:ATP-binding cassette [Mactra antiquata]